MRSDHIYAALFRVAISLLLFADIISSLSVASEIYNIPGNTYFIDGVFGFIAELRRHIYWFLGIYLVVLVLFLFGIGKNLTAAVVFLLTFLDHIMLHPAVYWGDSVLRFSLLYFIFADSFRYFALQRTKGQTGIIHQIALMSVMVHLCLMYASNAWYKWWSEDWVTGWATGYFFQSTKTNDLLGIGSFILDYPSLIQLSTWSILLYQTTFPIFIWFKRLKWIWIISGILIHLIMAVTLQLYKFELIIILLYGFFITDKEWQHLISRIPLKINYGKR